MHLSYNLHNVSNGHFPLFLYSDGKWLLREIDTLEYSRPQPGKKYISPDQSLAFMGGENATVIRQFFKESSTDEYISLGIASFGVAAYNVALMCITQPGGHGDTDISNLTGSWEITTSSAGALSIRRDADLRLSNVTHNLALDWVENF